MSSIRRAVQGLFTSTLALCTVACGGSGGSTDVLGSGGEPAPVLTWARSIDGTAITVLSAVQQLPDGSCVAIGYMGDSITFKTGGTPEPTLSTSDGTDGFLVRYAPDGSFVWARRLAGVGPAGPAQSVAVMTDGQIMVAGYFGYQSGTLTLGEGAPNETTLTSLGNDDVFLARFTGAGDLLWARSVGSPNADQALAMTALPGGAAAIAGMIGGPVTFGAGEPNQTSLPGLSYEAFVARYESNGDLGWAKSTDAAGYAIAWGVASGAGGAVLFAGTLSGPVTFGPGELNPVTVSSLGGSDDVFLASLASDGTLQWVRTAGGLEYDEVYGLAAGPDGSARIAGGFYGSSTFGSEGPTPVDLVAPPGAENAFLASYGADGDLQWARQTESLPGGGASVGRSVSVGSDGSTIVAGSFSGTVTLRFSDDTTTSATSVGGTDGFVARYLQNGDLDWAMAVGSFGEDGVVGVSMLLDVSVAITGFHQGEVTFGAGDPNETTFSDTGNTDAFIARYAPTNGF